MPRENRALAWALLVSLLIHGALLLAPPVFWETIEYATRTPPPIVARLVGPPPPPAPKPPPPSPPKKEAKKKPPAAPPPLPEKRPRPVQKEAVPQAKERAPEQVREKEETQSAPPSAEPAPPSSQPAVPPAPRPAQPAVKPAPSAPQPAPPAPPVLARQPDIPSLIGQYASALKSEMRRQVKYPARARDEGWEGEGRLLLVVSEDGKVVRLGVVKSSGYALLDRTLLEGALRAQARIEIPSGLRGRRFELEIPFVMNLVDE